VDAGEDGTVAVVVRGLSIWFWAVLCVIVAVTEVVRADPAPSFNCAKATAAIEKSICSSSALAGADADLALLFAKVRDRIDGQRRASLLTGQRNWLELREVACPAGKIAAAELEDCLQRLYSRRLVELNRQVALLDEEAAHSKRPRADIDAVRDAKRELAAYAPTDMSEMHRYTGGEWHLDEGRLPQTCRERDALVEGQVWQHGTDTIGASSQAVAELACEYALRDTLKWPSAVAAAHDARFDDVTKYSWEWANLTGGGDGYEGKAIGSFAGEQRQGKISIAQVSDSGREMCAKDDPERETLSVQAGKADAFCFGGWTFLINKRAFGDFTHHGREEALTLMTMLPSGPIGTYREHRLVVGYYDPATDSIRPEALRPFFAGDLAPNAVGGPSTGR
jgi:uncharacterized protein